MMDIQHVGAISTYRSRVFQVFILILISYKLRSAQISLFRNTKILAHFRSARLWGDCNLNLKAIPHDSLVYYVPESCNLQAHATAFKETFIQKTV